MRTTYVFEKRMRKCSAQYLRRRDFAESLQIVKLTEHDQALTPIPENCIFCLENGRIGQKQVTSTPAALRFGPAEYLLRALSGGAANLDQFWQSVVERMKRYGFYFVDPRLVSIEFRGSSENRRRQSAGN